MQEHFVEQSNINSKLWERLLAPAYAISEAARYAHANPQTVSYWHRGASRGALLDRSEKAGTPLSYMELAEIAFVAVMREQGISLQRIRRARQYLLERVDAPYPFATFKFKTEGVHILLDLKDFHDEANEHDVIIADEGGQTAWGDMLARKFHQFEYVHDLAMRWFPLGKDKSVFIDPRVAFGQPNIKGVPTKSIKGRAIAGESLSTIKEDFDLSIPEIRAALQFEGVDASRVPLH